MDDWSLEESEGWYPVHVPGYDEFMTAPSVAERCAIDEWNQFYGTKFECAESDCPVHDGIDTFRYTGYRKSGL